MFSLKSNHVDVFGPLLTTTGNIPSRPPDDEQELAKLKRERERESAVKERGKE